MGISTDLRAIKPFLIFKLFGIQTERVSTTNYADKRIEYNELRG